jgi:signal transduction histidine kinase
MKGSEVDSGDLGAPPLRFSALWHVPLVWWRNVPIADPVDRRNAPMLQLICLLLAVLPAAAWAYRFLALDIPLRPGELTSMALSLSVCAAAAGSFVLIRLGHFVWASRLLLVAFAVTVIPAYWLTGFTAQRFEQPVLVIWMAVAGLVVGRAALWLMLATIAIAFYLGISVDVARQGDAAALYSDAVFSAAMFLMIAIVLDRSASSLRHSLREANVRGAQLLEANRLLKQEMQERERTQEQLVHAQKVETVGRLASGTAHDFGNLLSVITGYARKGLRADHLSEAKEALLGVETASKSAAFLTKKLLAFARKDEYKEEIFDVAEAVQSLSPMLNQLFNPKVKQSYEVDQGLPKIRLDRRRFELMVLNIAANSEHAMPDGGAFGISAKADGDQISLMLSDTGAGMEDGVLSKVFEPFFSTKPAGVGVGLGLSVVYDLVTGAGGSVIAESASGEGTTITIKLPAVYD